MCSMGRPLLGKPRLMRFLPVALFLLLVPAAAAQEEGGSCLTADPPPAWGGSAAAVRHHATARGQRRSHPGGARSRGPRRRRPPRCRQLRPKRRELVLRLNRLFWSEGTDGHQGDGPARTPLRTRRVPERDPGPLPPAGGPRGRHRGVRGVRRDRRAPARQAARGRRLLDHERGEPADLAEHLGRRLRGRRRRARPRRDRRPARASQAPARAARRRLQRDVAVEPGQRPPVLGGHRRPSGRGPLPQSRGQRRSAGLPGTRLAAGADPRPHRRRRGRGGAHARARLLHAEGGTGARDRAMGQRERLPDEPRSQRGIAAPRPSSRRSRRSRSCRAPSA